MLQCRNLVRMRLIRMVQCNIFSEMRLIIIPNRGKRAVGC